MRRPLILECARHPLVGSGHPGRRLDIMTPLLADAIFWLAVVSCAVAQFAILRSTVQARAGYAASPARRPATRLEEIVWAVAPALVLATLLFFTWRAVHPRPIRADVPAGIVAETAEAAR